jgi:hypothetical protein
MKTSNNLGFLDYAFKKSVLSVFTKFKVASVVLTFAAAGLWDWSHTLGGMLLGLAIGTFVVTLINEAGVRAMFVAARAIKTADGKIEVSKEGITLRIETTQPTVNWLDDNKNSFWFTTGYLFCQITEGPQPSKSP